SLSDLPLWCPFGLWTSPFAAGSSHHTGLLSGSCSSVPRFAAGFLSTRIAAQQLPLANGSGQSPRRGLPPPRSVPCLAHRAYQPALRAAGRNWRGLSLPSKRRHSYAHTSVYLAWSRLLNELSLSELAGWLGLARYEQCRGKQV